MTIANGESTYENNDKAKNVINICFFIKIKCTKNTNDFIISIEYIRNTRGKFQNCQGMLQFMKSDMKNIFCKLADGYFHDFQKLISSTYIECWY